MGEFAVISRRTVEEPQDPVNLEQLPAARLVIGAGYHGQYFVVEEIGSLMRVIAGPFTSAQAASEAHLSLQHQPLQNAS